MPVELAFPVQSLTETEALARRLGGVVFPGAVLALVGPLGAGKTHFTRALAEGLQVDHPEFVNSPTFVLIQEYSGPIPLYHFDTYRLLDPRDFANLGVEEYLFGDGVCAIEWADKVLEHLPQELLVVEFQILGENQRRIRLEARGHRYEELLKRIGSEVID